MQQSINARHAWLLLIPAVVWLVLVLPGLRGPFVFDDFPNLAALASVETVDTWRELGIYLSQVQSFPGRPLAMLSFLPHQADWPGDPYAFKAVNLALHVLNAVLLFLLLRQLARQFTDAPRARWIAALAALAWLVHPMQLSTVFLVIQRMALLATGFMLLGLLAYVHGVLATGASTRVRALWMGAGLAGGTLCAVLCKESGALLPLLALVVDATLLRAKVADLPRALMAWRRLLIVPAVALLAVFLLWQLRGIGDDIAIRDFTLGERLLTQPRVLLDYLHKTLVPSYTTYAVFNDDFVTSRSLLQPWTTLPALLAVLGALAAALAWRRSRPLLAFGVLWFLGAHLLEAGPLNLEMYFEHRNYLPMAGVLFAVIAGFAMLDSASTRKAAGLTVGVWLLACLFATALYAQVWSNPQRLAFFWAQAHPASPRAQTLLAKDFFDRGRIPEARITIDELTKTAPADDGAPLIALFIDCSQRIATRAQVDDVTKRLRNARLSLAVIQAVGELRQLASLKSCPAALDDATWLRMSDQLLANPAYGGGIAARLHYQRHELAVAQGDLDRALAELDAAARLDGDAEIARLKAKYLAEAGLVDDAISVLETYDGSRRSRLRRWLVDDEAINRELAQELRERRQR